MKRRWMLRGLKIAVFGVLTVTVAGLVVTALWNWLAPTVFGWHTINFGQALGLLVLSRILFGGFRGGGPRMDWRRRMGERWEQMSPEEREKFLHGLRGRCGHFGMPEPDAKV
jgi:hypothetical protein